MNTALHATTTGAEDCLSKNRNLQYRTSANGLTQAEATGRLHTTQPILNGVITGRYERFTFDRLANVLDAAGLHWSVSASGVSRIKTFDQTFAAVANKS